MFDYDQQGRFRVDLRVGYNDLSAENRANCVNLLSMAQEASLAHSASVGLGLDYFGESKSGWVITRWDAAFFGYPSWGERVRAFTWPCSFKGFVAERAFDLFNERGERLMAAHSTWLYFDADKRVPIRPDKTLTALYGGTFPPSVEADFNFNETAELKPIGVKARTVLRSDADSMGHMNNVRYVSWAYDCLKRPETIKRLKAYYKKERREGDRVILETYETSGAVSVRMKGENGEQAAWVDMYY